MTGDLGDCASEVQELRELAALEADLDPGGAGLAATLHQLGEAESACNHPEAAEEALEEALTLRRQLFGPDSAQALATEHSAAQLLLSQGRYLLAIERLTSLLDKRRGAFGEDHLAIVETQNDLALALHYNGQLAQAAEIYTAVLEDQEQFLGTGHGQIAVTLFNLAVLRRDLGELEVAEGLFREALAQSRQVFGEGHPLEADCLQDLSRLARHRGELQEAEQLLQQALDIRLAFFGPESPEAAKSGLGFANLIAKTDPQAAERAYVENIALHDKVLGTGDFRSSYPRLRLARLLLRLDRPGEAATRAREALDIRKRALPAGHFEIAIAEGYLGQALADQRRIPEAIEVLQSSYNSLLSSLGPDDPKTQLAQKRLRHIQAKAESATTPPSSAAQDP